MAGVITERHVDATKGAIMGEMFIFLEDGTAEMITAEGEREQIVIYCDLCNEPIAITTKLGCDDVFLQCIKCHAVTNTNG
jgi:hypothetical protein